MTTTVDDDAETEMELVHDSNERLSEESGTRTDNNWTGVGRRPLLKALGAGTALSVGSGVATADDDDDTDDDEGQADQPEGAEVEVLAPHGTFPDTVAMAFGVDYEDGPEGSTFLHDASTVVVVRATLEPGGTSGWHTDQGPAIAVVVEGEVEITFEGDDDECFTRTYAAGEAVVATGNRADVIDNVSDTEQAVAYIMMLGVPDGEPPSKPAEPPDC